MKKIIKLKTVLTKQEYEKIKQYEKEDCLNKLYIKKTLTFKNKKGSGMKIVIKVLTIKSIYFALISSGVLIWNTVVTHDRNISSFDMLGIINVEGTFENEEKSFIINIEPDFSNFEDYTVFLYYRFH